MPAYAGMTYAGEKVATWFIVSDLMNEDDINNISLEQYLQLKKQVDNLYNNMMELHALRKRDANYANARSAYMEKRNILQQVLEAHPEYEQQI
jgi:ABC-type transporter lipoprotein component MlaA